MQSHNGADTDGGEEPSRAYARTLSGYLAARGEDALDRTSRLSRSFIEQGLGPEEIVALHAEAIERATAGRPYRDRARVGADGLQFLLEVMIAYGVHYRAVLDLRLSELDQEARAAVDVERQKTTDAERAESEKDDILAQIAHELRTPITAALGNLDLAARSLERGTPDGAPGYLDSARQALLRLSRLSEDLVEASRGEPPPPTPVPHAADELVAQACAWARVAAEEKGVVFECPPTASECSISGDADVLLTVFGNLLSNAIRYTEPGGRVTVRQDVEGAWWRFEVRDTGIGMSPDVQARIFDRFYRSPEARVADPRGLGLGLALARRLVSAHGGRLEVHSALGVGSTFRVLLPRTTPAPPA